MRLINIKQSKVIYIDPNPFKIQIFINIKAQTLPISMNNDINCVFQGLGSIGAIFISNAKAANNLTLLQKLNIKTVITAATGRRIQYTKTTVTKYLYLPIEDTEDFNIQKYFDQTFTFIQESRKSTNVLIHCHIGASRSVAIVIAYLIRKYNYSLPQIYTLIKRKRSKIEPNPGFIRQLQQYSTVYSVKQDNTHFEIAKSKKVKRSYSLVPQTNYNSYQFNFIKTEIKSEQLRQKISLTKRAKVVIEQQKQTIKKLHIERQQIQEKLKRLRQGLIRGAISSQGYYKSKKVQKQLKQNKNSQNINPNYSQKLKFEPVNLKKVFQKIDLQSNTSTKLEQNSQWMQNSSQKFQQYEIS